MQVALKNIGLAYEKGQPLFQQLNCVIPDGALVALVGPSGCGKTTLLNLIAGLLTPDHGTVWFDDQDVSKQDVAKRGIGMVFQDHALYPHLNVLANIAFPLKMAHVKKHVREQQAREMARFIQIEDQLDKFPSELSGGQQQRVAIARALVKHPAILLLDEPLSNLDATLRIQLRQEIRRIQQATQTTTVFVTHDQNDALQIADQIILMHHGQIQQVGTGMTLYQHPRNQFVAQFIGTPQMTLLPVTLIEPSLANRVFSTRFKQASRIGFRSEAVKLATDKSVELITQPATVVRQVVVGRDTETELKIAGNRCVSTAISDHLIVNQHVKVQITPQDCYLFDATGICIWEGQPHAKR